MDHSYPYIASLTREPFLFYEMRSTAKLMVEGNSDDAIVKEIVEQNLFQYPTEKSITRMAKACIKRLHALEDDSLVSAIASQPTEYLDNRGADHLNPVWLHPILENAIRSNGDTAVLPAFNCFV